MHTAASLIPLVALTVSIASALLSILTFLRNSDRAQLRRLQIDKMRAVAARSTILLDQIMTIISADVGGFNLDGYLYPSVKSNAKRLEEALDAAISLGLIEKVLSNRVNALPMYNAFAQSLYFASEMTEPADIRAAFMKDHLTLGLIRLLDQCLDFGQHLLPSTIEETTRAYIEPRSALAWDYLESEGRAN